MRIGDDIEMKKMITGGRDDTGTEMTSVIEIGTIETVTKREKGEEKREMQREKNDIGIRMADTGISNCVLVD